MNAAARTDAAQGEAPGRSQVRGSSLLMVGRVLSLLFTVSTQVLVVRSLSTTDYAVVAYALALVASGRVLLSLGQGKILSRFLTHYDERGEPDRMLGSLVLAALTIAVTSAACFAVLPFVAGGLLESVSPADDAVAVLLVLVLLAPMEAVDQVFIALFAVFTRPRAIFFRKYVLTPALRLLVVALLALTGQRALFLAIGYVLAQAVGLVLYAVMLTGVFRRRGLTAYLRPSRLTLPVRPVLRLALPTLTGEFVFLSMTTGSVVLLGVYWGALELAAYAAVLPAARLNQFVYSAFGTLYLPTAARLHARGDRAGSLLAYWQTAVVVAVFSFPVLAMTTVFAAGTTVLLFGERYASSADVLVLLSIGYYVNAALGHNAYTLVAFGRGRLLATVNVTCALTNLLLCWLLVPEHGAVGVGIANCATLALQNALYQWDTGRVLGCSPLPRSRVRPYLLVLAACGVLLLVDLALQPGVLVAIPLVLLVWAGLLLLTREQLELAQTFPELRRVPLLGRLL